MIAIARSLCVRTGSRHATAATCGVVALVFHAFVNAGGELPGYYQNPGFDSSRSLVNHTQDEHIDPFSGLLQLHHVDASVPGNGGLTLSLHRAYNHPGSAFGSMSDTLSYNRTPNLGIGWSLLIGGRLFGAVGTGGACTGGNQMAFETPDGHRQALLRQTDGTFMSAARWKATCVGGGVEVRTPNGLRYDMLQSIAENIPGTIQSAPFLYPTRIEDRNANHVAFVYEAVSGVTVLSTVTTSDSRTISFEYGTLGTSNVVMLAGVRVGTRHWTYWYAPTPALLDPNSGKGVAFFLVEVEPPAGGSWGYANNPCNTASAGRCAIAGTVHPATGTTSYTYGFVNFNDGAGNTPVIRQKSVGGLFTLTSSSSNVWDYAYTPGSIGVDDKTEVTTPLGTTTYRHVGYSTVGAGSTWQIGLIKERSMRSLGGTLLQTETYTWDKQQISAFPTTRVFGINDGVTYAPLQLTKILTRQGSTFTTTNSNFDAYGNALTTAKTGGRPITHTRVLFNDPAKWIIGVPKDETITGIGSILRTLDAKGQVLTETKYGVFTGYTYHGTGDISSKTDALGNTTVYSGYKRGIAQTEQHPEAVTVSRIVSDHGDLLSQTDGAGNAYAYTYDGAGRLATRTSPVGAATSVVWVGSVQRTATRGAFTEVSNFDGMGNPFLVTKAGVPQLSAVDVLQRRTFQSLPGGLVEGEGGVYSASGTTAERDFLGRVTRVSNPDASFRLSTPDGMQVTHRDERANTTYYKYWALSDPDDRHLYEIAQSGMGGTTTINRDNLGNVTSVVRGSVTRTYGYNGSYFLTSLTEPETGTSTFGRDSVGNMTSRTVGGRTTTFTYDGLNRVKQISYPDGVTVTATYLGNGKRASLTSPVATRSYGYDGNGNLLTETLAVGAQSFTVQYTYDGNDSLQTITYPRTGHVVTYSPDSLGRPTAALPFITGVTYWPSGNPKKMSYANGIDYEVDENSRQWPANVGAQRFDRSQPEFFRRHYDYDAAGNVLQIYEGDMNAPRELFQMTYDTLNQLATSRGPWGTVDFLYDGLFNITRNGSFYTSYAYDTGTRRLNSVDGKALSYDVYANVTSFGTQAFQYNDASNLTCVDCGTANEIRYEYDGNNRRVKRVKGSEVTYYVEGTNGDLLLEFTTPSNVALMHIYLAGKRIATKRVQL